MKPPKRFQTATVDRALTAFSSKTGPRRFLIADEVGLGKTVVAREIVCRLAERKRKPLVVFYVSNGTSVATQTRPGWLSSCRKRSGSGRSIPQTAYP